MNIPVSSPISSPIRTRSGVVFGCLQKPGHGAVVLGFNVSGWVCTEVMNIPVSSPIRARSGAANVAVVMRHVLASTGGGVRVS